MSSSKIKVRMDEGQVVYLSDYEKLRAAAAAEQPPPIPIFNFDPNAFLTPSGVTLSTAAHVAIHQYVPSESEPLKRFQEAEVRSVSVDHVVRFISTCVGASAILSLIAYMLTDVILIHPLLSILMIFGAVTFYLMSRQKV